MVIVLSPENIIGGKVVNREMSNLLEEILDMDARQLLNFIKKECAEREMVFDSDMVDGGGKQALYDYIADNLYSDLQGELHSECQLNPGCGMFPNAETEEELEEAVGHEMSRFLD